MNTMMVTVSFPFPLMVVNLALAPSVTVLFSIPELLLPLHAEEV